MKTVYFKNESDELTFIFKSPQGKLFFFLIEWLEINARYNFHRENFKTVFSFKKNLIDEKKKSFSFWIRFNEPLQTAKLGKVCVEGDKLRICEIIKFSFCRGQKFGGFEMAGRENFNHKFSKIEIYARFVPHRNSAMT